MRIIRLTAAFTFHFPLVCGRVTVCSEKPYRFPFRISFPLQPAASSVSTTDSLSFTAACVR